MVTMILEMFLGIGLILVVLQVAFSIIGNTFLGKSLKLIFMFFKLSLKATYNVLFLTYGILSKELNKYGEYVKRYEEMKKHEAEEEEKEEESNSSKIIKVNFDKKSN